MSVNSASAGSGIWSSAASALTSMPSSKSAHSNKPFEVGNGAASSTDSKSGGLSSLFPSMSGAMQSQMIQMQADQ